MATVLSTSLKDAYKKRLQGQIDQANQSTAASKMPYTYNIKNAASAYQPQRNDLYTQNAASSRALREKMANYGLGGAGGTSQRQMYNLANALKTGLTNVDVTQQQYVDEQNNQMSQLDAQNQATIAGLTAQNDLELSHALANQKAIEDQRALSLFLAGKLSKADYQKATGVTW